MPKRGEVADLIGRRFGRLIVESFAGQTPRRQSSWLCRCDCGAECTALRSNLLSGRTSSCGCVKRERNQERSTHGEAERTPEWHAWTYMLSRVRATTGRRFRDYGARGIGVCDRWTVFESFLADMGRKPSPEHSLDRIDNDRGYEPGNCRWATAAEQRSNQRAPVRRQKEDS